MSRTRLDLRQIARHGYRHHRDHPDHRQLTGGVDLTGLAGDLQVLSGGDHHGPRACPLGGDVAVAVDGSVAVGVDGQAEEAQPFDCAAPYRG